MSREEDKRLYEQKKCIYNGEIIDAYLIGDYDFIESELVSCTDPKSLESTEKALSDTARTLDNIATEKRELEAVDGESVEHSTTFQDILATNMEQVKTSRILNKGKGFITWFYPCTNVHSLHELETMDLPPQLFLIDDFLPLGGAVMVSARPKVGKTFLALQMALAVATGGKFLGYRSKKRGVLYVDFESDERNMLGRTTEMIDTENQPENIFLMQPENPFEFGRVGNGFEKQVETFINSHKSADIRLVVVDTYGHIQGARDSRKNNVYNIEYEEIAKINRWAKRFGITVILIHHNNKNGEDYNNPVSGISGSTGITAGLTAYYVLTKQNYDDKQVKLTVGGKEIREQDIFLQPTSDNNRAWERVTPAEIKSRISEVVQSNITKCFAEAFQNAEVNGQSRAVVYAKEVEKDTGLTPISIGKWVQKHSGDLFECGYKVTKGGRDDNGTYYYVSGV